MTAAAKVLIVDDNPMNVELVSYVLAADGIDVEPPPTRPRPCSWRVPRPT